MVNNKDRKYNSMVENIKNNTSYHSFEIKCSHPIQHRVYNLNAGKKNYLFNLVPWPPRLMPSFIHFLSRNVKHGLNI